MGTHLIELTNPRYISGITDEPKQLLQPILGYALQPLVSLEEACEPISNIVPHLATYIWIAKECSKESIDDLTQDESAAIRLYTMEWDPNAHSGRESLYSHLNRTLKGSDRAKLRPWFPFLKLFLTALAKLPALPRQTVWRGVRKDLSGDYEKDSKATWWGFSSCTTSLSVLESDLYLGNTGIRTLFSIETFNARSIRTHSHFQAEDEILLLPGTYFEVISQLKSSSDLYIIHLRQIRPPYQLLEPPFEGAELLPIFDSDSDMKKKSSALLIEENDIQSKSRLKKKKKKKIGISLGILAVIIIIGIILGAVLGTQLGKNKSSKTLYWVGGPQVNLDSNLLTGWTQCYNGSYHKLLYGEELNTILTQCNKGKLLMACSFMGDTNLTVAAMGDRSDVTYPAANQDDFKEANGVRWYFVSDSGWGFAPIGHTFQRTYCDVVTDDASDQRLCWHTVSNLDGFRCGEAIFNGSIYDANQWFRIVYHAD